MKEKNKVSADKYSSELGLIETQKNSPKNFAGGYNQIDEAPALVNLEVI